MANWTSLRPALKTKLTAISGLGSVTDFYTNEVAGFPAVMFEPSQDGDKFLTNRENEHIYSFDIMVVQEITTTGRSASIATLAVAVDSIVAALDADVSLSSACDFCEPSVNNWGTAIVGEGSIVFAKIVLKCHTASVAF